MARVTGRNVVATFSDLAGADAATLSLSRHGVESDRISVLGRAHDEAAAATDTHRRDQEATGEVARKAGAAGAAGTVVGAAAGAAAFAIPGIGPVLGTGIWAGLLSGGVAGGVIGGMVGGVGSLSNEEFDLKYQGALRDGKALVAVAVPDDQEEEDVRRVLAKQDPERVEVLDAKGVEVESQTATGTGTGEGPRPGRA